MFSGNMTMKMEVDIISKTMIKPSLPELNHLKPFKLSILDQLIPSTYTPLIIFYPCSSVAHFKSVQLSTKLKNSLSEALSIFYPFSGRLIDNLYVDHYEEGVPYIEARVDCSLFDFLQRPQMESLNQFLPCKAYRYESNPTLLPQLAIQMNIFNCGGIAIGMCGLHKLIDGFTSITLLNCWTSLTRGSSSYRNYNKVIDSDEFLQGSLHFPPNKSLPQKYLSVTENIWFNNEGKHETRRFVFDAKAMATIRAMSISEGIENPSRTEALSAFICKYAMEASKAASNYMRPSFVTQAVNIRSKMTPRLSKNSIGNLVWSVMAMHNSAHRDTEIKMPSLVEQMNEAVTKINSDFLNTLQGEEGWSQIYKLMDETEGLCKKEKVDIYNLSSWIKLGLDKIDFGWGKPIWVGILGDVADQASRNFIFFKDIGSNNAIEAWVTLKEKQMAILENDPEFLEFASPNPSILIP